MAQRKVLWVSCSPDEHDLIMALAHRDGISVPNYIRRCINGALLEEGEEDLACLFLEEKRNHIRRRPLWGWSKVQLQTDRSSRAEQG